MDNGSLVSHDIENQVLVQQIECDTDAGKKARVRFVKSVEDIIIAALSSNDIVVYQKSNEKGSYLLKEILHIGSSAHVTALDAKLL